MGDQQKVIVNKYCLICYCYYYSLKSYNLIANYFYNDKPRLFVSHGVRSPMKFYGKHSKLGAWKGVKFGNQFGVDFQ